MSISPLFEANFSKQAAPDADIILDVLDSLEPVLCSDPYACGAPHASFAATGLWIWQSPPLRRLPTLYILYEIDAQRGKIILWNFHK